MLKRESNILLVFGFLNILFHGAAPEEKCLYDNVQSINACQKSTLTGDRGNVYHEILPSATSCECTVNVFSGPVSVTLSNVPGDAHCRSSLNITKSDASTVYLTCTSRTANLGQNFGNKFVISFSSNADVTLPRYCIYIQAIGLATMNINCGSTLSTAATLTPEPSTTTSTATSTKTATTTLASTTTKSTSKPTVKTTEETSSLQTTSTSLSTQKIPSSKSTTSTSVHTIGQTTLLNETATEITAEQSSSQPTGSPKATKSDDEGNTPQLPLYVIILAAVGGGVILVVLIVIIVVFMRKRKFPKNKPKANTQGIDSNSNDGDEMKVNILYESYDDVPKNNKQNTVLDDIGEGYSEVGSVPAAENHKSDHIDGYYSEIELHSSTSKHGDGGISKVEIPSKDKEIMKSGNMTGAYDEVKLPSNRTEPRNDTKPSKIDVSVTPQINQVFPVYSMPNKVSKEKFNVEQTTEPFPVYALPDKKMKPNDKRKSSSEAVKPDINEIEPRHEIKPSKVDDSVTPHMNQDFPVYSMPNKVSKEKSDVGQTTEPFPVYALPDKEIKPNDKRQSSSEVVTDI